MMRSSWAIALKLFVLQYLSFQRLSQDFDFFYFVQQWPGSYCDTKQSCCYPTTGKPPSDFSIHGLWPSYINGRWPQNCDPDRPFDVSEISDLIGSMEEKWGTLSCPSNDGTKFWEHEWTKHGTCSESQLDQHDYFEAALRLKDQLDILQILKDAEIEPNDGFYYLKDIENAIKEASGFTPQIQCNRDPSGNNQLYQIYMCVDTSGSKFIECPITKNRGCKKKIQFPVF